MFTGFLLYTFDNIHIPARTHVFTGLFTGLLWSLHTHSQLGAHGPRKPTPRGKRNVTRSLAPKVSSTSIKEDIVPLVARRTMRGRQIILPHRFI